MSLIRNFFTKKKTLQPASSASAAATSSHHHRSLRSDTRDEEDEHPTAVLPDLATMQRAQLERQASSGDGKLGATPREIAVVAGAEPGAGGQPGTARRFRESTVMADPQMQYELINEVGEGSYGKVFKARNKLTLALYAIKVIPIPPDHDLSELNKEISALKKVHDSPYVVGYHGSFQQDDHVWIVMDLCEAGSMSDVISVCQRELSEAEICEVVASTVLGLTHLHSNKLIHRDIKAGNILLTADGRAKLADFGVSAQITTLNARRDTLIGTPYWMAPEVIMEQKYDCKCDVWSLVGFSLLCGLAGRHTRERACRLTHLATQGITMIEMAEGVPPLDHIHPMRAIFQIPKRDPPKFNDEAKWSPDMVDFLAKCLVKDPAARASALELSAHKWICDRVATMKLAGGRSDLIQTLAEECGPIVAQHYSDKEHEEFEPGGGDTLKVKRPVALAKTRKPVTHNNKEMTFLETGTMQQFPPGDDDGDANMRATAAAAAGGDEPANAEPPDFMKYFKASGEE
jgi:serine/threonine protein kinase